MTDIQKLKALAEKSLSGEWFKPGELRYHDDKTGDTHGLHHDDDDFIAAANPAAVLDLIAELEDFQRGAKVEADAGDEARVEVRQLKAENEALRKDAERAEKAAEFVQRLRNAAGRQPSVATGYLDDILSVMSKESGHD